MKHSFFLFLFLCGYAGLLSAQNIGIGTLTPAEKLDVNGNIRADTLKPLAIKIMTDAGAGKVLTSDANGVAGWQTAPGSLKTVNGLRQSGDSAKLGGLLTENTVLRLNGNTLLFTDTGSASSVMLGQLAVPLAFGLSAAPLTQTITIPDGGSLSAIEVYVAAFANTSISLQLKDATGTTIGTVTNHYPVIFNNWSSFVFPPLLINAGQTYTLSLTCTGTTQVYYDNANPYAGGLSSIGTSADIGFKIIAAAEKNLLLLKGNRIGVNTNTPSATLDINGSFRLKDGSQGAGKFLVSDASGNAGWQPVSSTTLGGWGITGNAGINASVNFIGTTDNIPLVFRINNAKAGIIDTSGSVAFGRAALLFNPADRKNTAFGDSALYKNGTGAVNGSQSRFNTATGYKALKENTTGSYNTALGALALTGNNSGAYNSAFGESALLSNTSGSFNTAVGAEVLVASTTAFQNTGIGSYALFSNTTGSSNTAVGSGALSSNTTASNNTALGANALGASFNGTDNTAAGANALSNNDNGSRNIAVGAGALAENSSGNGNIAIGNAALYANTGSHFLVAIGDSALHNNTTGIDNTATGQKTLFANTTGSGNSATGNRSLSGNTTGSYNSAFGMNALQTNFSGSHNTAIGYTALQNTTGSNNTALGSEAGVLSMTGFNNTFIGKGATASSGVLVNATALGANAIVSASNALVLGNNANVGIGVSSPVAKLHVEGKTRTTDFQMTNGAVSEAVMTSDGAGNGQWKQKILFRVSGLTDTLKIPDGVWRTVDKWGNVEINYGNAFFNYLTGEYYVPASGIYRITYRFHAHYDNNGGECASGIAVNGGVRAENWMEPIQGHLPVQGNFMLPLNAGDKVKVYYYNFNSTGDARIAYTFRANTGTFFNDFTLERIY